MGADVDKNYNFLLGKGTRKNKLRCITNKVIKLNLSKAHHWKIARLTKIIEF